MRLTLASGSGFVLAVALAWPGSGTVSAAQDAIDASSPQFYAKQVQPILEQNCYSCHTDGAAADLHLDTLQAILAGGKSGPAIKPGDAAHSLLIRAVEQTGDLKMPQGGRLKDAEIAELVAWVNAGAKGSDAAPQSTAAAAPASGETRPAAMVAVAASGSGNAANEQFFETHIKPLLTDRCFTCHTDAQSGGLRLDSRAAILQGGNSGPAIVPGHPDQSLLIEAVQQTGDLKMPKGGKLSPAEVADLETWVRSGAVWPEEAHPQPTAAISAKAATADGSAEFFETNIRPILANNCYSCHSDGAAAGLRLDSRDAILKGGRSGPALVPGDPAHSLLIQAVQQTGALKMPEGGKLSSEDVAKLVEWVRMKAPWPATAPQSPASDTVTAEQRGFWSFQPIHMPQEPKLRDAHWARTPIDRFVMAKLEAEGLKPAAPADRRTLIRRATFDLTGLPPTPEEVAAFVKDKSPDAFAKVVDRLLASPRYGERWGRHWLDVARYADDDVRGLDPKGRGYMPFLGAYTYRDWVIKSVNADMPYDQFVRMQLAGDFLAKSATGPAKFDDWAATAYIGDGPWLWDQAEPIQGRADEEAERVDAVSRGLLGLTVGCARCHNHKYDPISQRDYYSMVGLFASSHFNQYPTASAAAIALYEAKQDELVALETERDEFLKNQSNELGDALSYQTSKYMVAAWRVLGKPQMKTDDAADADKLDPQLLQRWVDYLKMPVRYPYLKDWQAMIAAGGSEDEARVLADGFQKLVLKTNIAQKETEKANEEIRIKADSHPRSRFIDTTPDKFETFDEFCPGCALTLKSLPADESELYDDIYQYSGADIGKPRPGVLNFQGWELRRRLSPILQDYLNTLDDKIAAAKKELPPFPFVNGVADKPTPVDVKVNLRGNPHTLGQPVPRRFLVVLSKPGAAPFSEGSGRLEFANDVIASPIATRVFVNRVWKWHFGTGIVDTPDDFGKRGDPPSNQELLEYLSAEFIHQGMSLKKLQREIMLSAVYQQADEESPEAHEKDAANRFYSHFGRQRLDAETLRDSVLFVAGDLDLKDVGGPPTPFGPDNTRRTVYGQVSRFRLSEYLQVFDFPNPGFSADQRFTSNVPLQRLYFMNDPFIYAQADKLAERVYKKPDDEARVGEMYELLFGRSPDPKELQLGLDFIHSTQEKPGYAVTGEPVTAWKEYARILLSSNEFEFLN